MVEIASRNFCHHDIRIDGLFVYQALPHHPIEPGFEAIELLSLVAEAIIHSAFVSFILCHPF